MYGRRARTARSKSLKPRLDLESDVMYEMDCERMQVGRSS